MSVQPGIPLEYVPEFLRPWADRTASVFRARWDLPKDARLRVILPDQLIREDGQDATAIVFLDGSFVTSEDEGYIDFGPLSDTVRLAESI